MKPLGFSDALKTAEQSKYECLSMSPRPSTGSFAYFNFDVWCFGSAVMLIFSVLLVTFRRSLADALLLHAPFDNSPH